MILSFAHSLPHRIFTLINRKPFVPERPRLAFPSFAYNLSCRVFTLCNPVLILPHRIITLKEKEPRLGKQNYWRNFKDQSVNFLTYLLCQRTRKMQTSKHLGKILRFPRSIFALTRYCYSLPEETLTWENLIGKKCLSNCKQVHFTWKKSKDLHDQFLS